MLYNNLNLECARIASKSESKPELAGVFFTKDKTVATDTFRLLEVSAPRDVNAEDYPQAMRGTKPFLVNARALKAIKIPKNKNLPVLEHVALKHVDDKQVRFMTTNLETQDVKTIKRVDGQFPQYEQIFPQGKPVAEVTVNGKELGELLEIVSRVDKKGSVRIRLYGDRKPLVLDANNGAQGARALQMPVVI